ncbi:act domain-containing protein acr4 [Phtheirospermum japonicum]|uniref:ACT domain-containing protein ACR n=1 Tax=Phtheirospermum japonicum TaxID=374723 RepID=A0A830DAA8_9LAMI|nr:act domain-containing protein acr4 [Phtheirospermum japonicum]
MNPPRVTIDNASDKKATLVKVDSANKRGSLLEVVQVLTDLNLIIRRAYISSDGGWFMDGHSNSPPLFLYYIIFHFFFNYILFNLMVSLSLPAVFSCYR